MKPFHILVPVGTFLICVVLYRLLHPVRYSEYRSCLPKVKQMGLGVVMYASDYDEILPKADKWMDKIVPYTKSESLFHDGALPPEEYGYAFREKASSLHSAKFENPDKYPVIFDSTLTGRNAHSELSTLPRPGRHSGYNSFGYLDGHAKSLQAH